MLQTGIHSTLHSRVAALTLCLIAQFAAPVKADYQAGLDAYMGGDFSTALSEWRAVANGSPDYVHLAVFAETHYAIGMLYWKGEGVARDTAKSAVWLKQAAEMNHRGAQVKLGYLYTMGEGVPRNYVEARRWLEMAAKQGDPDALYNLGVFYRDGLGVLPDEQESIKWFREAAEKGDADAALIVADASNSVNRRSDMPNRYGTRFQIDSPPTVVTEGNNPDALHSGALDTDVTILHGPATVDVGPEQESVEDDEIRSMDSVAEQPARQTAEFHRSDPERGDLGEDWILDQNPERYTIQVVALRRPDKLYDYIGANSHWAPFAIYRQLRYQNPLWVLVQGSYPDVASARAAKFVFPPGLSENEKLWIRRFDMVQALLD